MLFGTRCPLPSDSAKNLGFPFQISEERVRAYNLPLSSYHILAWKLCQAGYSCFPGELNARKQKSAEIRKDVDILMLIRGVWETESTLQTYLKVYGAYDLYAEAALNKEEGMGLWTGRFHRGQLVGEATWHWLSLRWALPFPGDCKSKGCTEMGMLCTSQGMLGANVNLKLYIHKEWIPKGTCRLLESRRSWNGWMGLSICVRARTCIFVSAPGCST